MYIGTVVMPPPPPATAPSDGLERRVDITDGNSYTKQEFVDFYGGEQQWNCSLPAPKRAAGAAPPPWTASMVASMCGTSPSLNATSRIAE